MLDLGDLLGRIKRSLDSDVLAREAVASVVRETLGFELRLSDISIKGSTLRIETTPAKRSEIKLHESKLLPVIREKTGLNIKSISY